MKPYKQILEDIKTLRIQKRNAYEAREYSRLPEFDELLDGKIMELNSLAQECKHDYSSYLGHYGPNDWYACTVCGHEKSF